MGEKFGKFVALVGAVVAIVLLGLVASWVVQLSQDARALLFGIAAGVVLGIIPLGVLVAIAVVTARWWLIRQERQSYQRAMQPPVVVVPQALPYYGGQSSYPVEWGSSPAEREFQVIGEE
jgi:hypothetical protein